MGGGDFGIRIIATAFRFRMRLSDDTELGLDYCYAHPFEPTNQATSQPTNPPCNSGPIVAHHPVLKCPCSDGPVVFDSLIDLELGHIAGRASFGELVSLFDWVGLMLT